MEKQKQKFNFEIWGGIECTLNRVNDKYFDQLFLTGHYSRPGDFELVASLGVKKLRYPLLWEIHEPEPNSAIDWSWASAQLRLIQEQKIEPIVGLVHHGSGPVHCDLTTDQFSTGLASYAGQVARKFPWVENYTPVNEPLTTARFSGLYGFWYPHFRDDLMFFRMLFNQIKGIVLSMREIRKINSDAKLIQTEDLAKTYSDPFLKYQADFENERRWLTYDLLCGKVNRHHALWDYLRWVGLSEREILFFENNPCIPDVAGFNYYLTSERFLDEEIDLYPQHLHGGNHRHKYVDTEAIRIDHGYPSGLSVLLQEAWDRFQLPMAMTEVFLSCTPDEQVRWVHDVVQQCADARSAGVDLRAITWWALFGEFGWNNLVTSGANAEYESGAFDVRTDEPAETLLGTYLREFPDHASFSREWIEDKGWWRREERYHHRIQCEV